MSNWLGLIIASLYVFIIIGLAEGLRRWRGWGSEFTRKVVHIGVGMLIWAVPWLFDSWLPFVATSAFFAGLTFLDNRYHFFPSMASKDDQHNWGTFYFPIAAAVVVYLLWDRPPLMVATLMPLTWGDGMAEVVGRTFGRNRYTIFGHTRSLQGSLAFLGFGFLFTWLALIAVPGPPALTAGAAFLPALVTVVLATGVEAIAIRGSDNLLVTAVALLVLGFWPF